MVGLGRGLISHRSPPVPARVLHSSFVTFVTLCTAASHTNDLFAAFLRWWWSVLSLPATGGVHRSLRDSFLNCVGAKKKEVLMKSWVEAKVGHSSRSEGLFFDLPREGILVRWCIYCRE